MNKYTMAMAASLLFTCQTQATPFTSDLIKSSIREGFIDLQDRQLTGSIPWLPSDSTHPRSMELSHNKIDSLGGIGSYVMLETLYLQNNQLTLIEGIRSLKYLVTLNVSENQVRSVKGIEDCSKLEALNISQNKLGSLKEIGNLKNLTVLDVSNNQIYLIPESIKGCTSLSSLNLSYNEIEEVNYNTLMDLENLYKISFVGNKMTFLPLKFIEWAVSKNISLNFRENPINISTMELEDYPGKAKDAKPLAKEKDSLIYICFDARQFKIDNLNNVRLLFFLKNIHISFMNTDNTFFESFDAYDFILINTKGTVHIDRNIADAKRARMNSPLGQLPAEFDKILRVIAAIGDKD